MAALRLDLPFRIKDKSLANKTVVFLLGRPRCLSEWLMLKLVGIRSTVQVLCSELAFRFKF